MLLRRWLPFAVLLSELPSQQHLYRHLGLVYLWNWMWKSFFVPNRCFGIGQRLPYRCGCTKHGLQSARMSSAGFRSILCSNHTCSDFSGVFCDFFDLHFLPQISGPTCMRYNAVTTGFCDGNGNCQSSGSYCSLLATTTSTGVSCGSAGCVKPGVCVEGAATSSISVSSLCYTDYSPGSCGNGMRCDASGTCVSPKSNGAVCAAPGECLSGNCVLGICCAAAGCPTCQTCESGTCSATPDGANSGCPTVQCSNYVSGWSSLTCATYSGSAGGYCSGGSCDTGLSRCSAGVTSGRPSCAESACQNSCPTGQLASSFSTVSSVCFQNGQHGCPVGSQCNSVGSCQVGLLANGNPCTSGSQCSSGICSDSGHCCLNACTGPCSDCSSGSCSVISNGPSSACPAVSCTSYIGGWSGTVCGAYDKDIPGFCSAGSCDTSISRCASESGISADTQTNLFCGSLECRTLGSCTAGALKTSLTSVNRTLPQLSRRAFLLTLCLRPRDLRNIGCWHMWSWPSLQLIWILHRSNRTLELPNPSNSSSSSSCLKPSLTSCVQAVFVRRRSHKLLQHPASHRLYLQYHKWSLAHPRKFIDPINSNRSLELLHVECRRKCVFLMSLRYAFSQSLTRPQISLWKGLCHSVLRRPETAL
jgi:hypothetical protein